MTYKIVQKLFCWVLFTLYTISAQAQQVNKALELFFNNQLSEAESMLTTLSNDMSSKERGKANIALALIHKLNDNNDEKVRCYVQGISLLDQPDAYAYTLWGDCYFYNYPKYAKQILEIFAGKQKVHPDINYCLDNLNRRLMIMNDQIDSVITFNNKRGYINQWELVGPFDYNDGYGYKNNEQTLTHSERNYTFLGKFNAPMNWFPLIEGTDASSVYLNEYLDLSNSTAAKMFAQTFVQSDIAQEAMLNIICGTDIQCWVNDALVYENRHNIENINSLPFHVPIKLNKGNNRILFQLGRKTNYANNFEVYLRDVNDLPLSNITTLLNERQYNKATAITTIIKDPDIESFNVQLFNKYLKEHPNDILEQLLRIEELNSTGDKKKTLAAVQTLHNKYPNSYYLSNIYYNNKPNVNYNTKDEYLNQQCENCFSTLNQKFEEAIQEKNKSKIKETLEKLERNFPNNQAVTQRKIDYQLGENEYTQAEKLIEDALAKYENRLLFYSYKSALLKAQAQKTAHIEYLKKILPTRNNSFVSERMKAHYLDENDTANWIKLQIQDMRYEKGDHMYLDLLNIYNNSKSYTLAENLLKQFIAKKPYSAAVWEEYGDLMLEKSDKRKAIECYKKSLQYYPLNYTLIKKINSHEDKKPEIDILLSLKMKEIFQQKKVEHIETPEALKSKNWVILLKKSASVTYTGELNVSRTFIFYKILNEAGINEFKEFSCIGSDVMIFKANGEVVLPESSFSSMVLTDLKVGDIIGMKYDNENTVSREYISSRYSTMLSSLENDPMVKLEEEHLVSNDITTKPLALVKGKTLTIEKKDWDSRFSLYKINATNPDYIEPELYPSNLLYNHEYILLHNYQSWDEVAKWYWEIASPTLIADDSLKNIVSKALAKKENLNEFAKAKLLYQWIQKNINYSSQSFRQDNYVPQLPSKVLEDKLGDCKDLSALFITMCKEVGIKGNLCLVNMDARAGLYKQFPNINFNHCIARIYADSKPYYIEMTSKSLPFAYNINYSTFGYGLEIDPQRACIISNVYNESMSDYFIHQLQVNLQDNILKLEGKIKICGLTAAILKDAFEKIDSSQINTALQKMIGDFIPNTNVEKCGYNTSDKWNDTAIVFYTASNTDLFTEVADLYLYKAPVFLNKIVEEAVFANSFRKTDLSFLQSTGMVGKAIFDIHINIPPNKKLLKKTEDKATTSAFFDYTISINQKGKDIQILKSFTPKVKTVNTSDFTLYAAQMEKAYKSDVVNIILE